MNALDLAREAYNAVAVKDDPEFDALPKTLQNQIVEIAEKGGDTTPFGQEIARIRAESQASEEEEATGGNGNGGNIELHDSEAELKKQNWDNLRDHARKIGIPDVPDMWGDGWTKGRVIELILEKQKSTE